jgi:hypothetical protein
MKILISILLGLTFISCEKNEKKKPSGISSPSTSPQTRQDTGPVFAPQEDSVIEITEEERQYRLIEDEYAEKSAYTFFQLNPEQSIIELEEGPDEQTIEFFEDEIANIEDYLSSVKELQEAMDLSVVKIDQKINVAEALKKELLKKKAGIQNKIFVSKFDNLKEFIFKNYDYDPENPDFTKFFSIEQVKKDQALLDEIDEFRLGVKELGFYCFFNTEIGEDQFESVSSDLELILEDLEELAEKERQENNLIEEIVEEALFNDDSKEEVE